MKKILTAALVLTMAVSCNSIDKKSTTKSNDEATIVADTTNVLKVTGSDLAYVNVDLVMSESELFKTEGATLRNKVEKTQKKFAGKEEALAKKAAALQEKYQKGLITTLDAQRQEQELQKEAQALQANAQKELKQLDEENVVFNNRMLDLLNRAILNINADKRYKMIVNASALLDADPSLDISSAVLAKVNELYRAEK